jgi:hypothetical protein
MSVNLEMVAAPRMSPLVLSDSLLRLAERADAAGLRASAEVLLVAASRVLELPAPSRAQPPSIATPSPSRLACRR